MSGSREFKCECRHCRGHLAFPAEAAGATIECPHCGKQTELAVPPPAPAPRRRTAVWLAVAACLLVAGGLGRFCWSRHLAQLAERRHQDEATAQVVAREAARLEARANDPFAKAGFGVSPLQIQKDDGSSILHVVGTVTNETDRRRFGVKIQLDLFDSADQKIGAANDYQATVEPGGQWQFKALVVNSKAVAAKAVAIEEAP